MFTPIYHSLSLLAVATLLISSSSAAAYHIDGSELATNQPASPAGNYHVAAGHSRRNAARHHARPRSPVAQPVDPLSAREPVASARRLTRRAKRCAAASASSTEPVLSASSAAPPASSDAPPASSPAPPASSAAPPASSSPPPASSAPPTTTLPADPDGKPANWPTATQAGDQPTATETSASDPLLEELSKAYNNKGNALYTASYSGDMTYYAQGQTACGDTYTDATFTAAVSHVMYDSWPGASANTNRNPICGPFVPGRKSQDPLTGQFVAVPNLGDGTNFAVIGGDGLINCDGVSQCHIPMTASVTHGNKTIQVQIVDRCAACKKGDIDLTPAAFSALADMALGRTSVEWHWNQY